MNDSMAYVYQKMNNNNEYKNSFTTIALIGYGGLTPLLLETRFWGQNYLDLI